MQTSGCVVCADVVPTPPYTKGIVLLFTTLCSNCTVVQCCAGVLSMMPATRRHDKRGRLHCFELELVPQRWGGSSSWRRAMLGEGHRPRPGAVRVGHHHDLFLAH